MSLRRTSRADAWYVSPPGWLSPAGGLEPGIDVIIGCGCCIVMLVGVMV